jgi:2-oxoglutarate dehydrogenase E2 component (dihydrolipoamide succinyltransferase)
MASALRQEERQKKMTIEVRVPPLGESVVEATVASWRKQEGEPVRRDEVLAELETDKVSVEVRAEQDGVLQQILKHEGEDVRVGEVLARLEEGPAGAVAAQPAASQRAPHATDGPRPPSPLARRIAAEYNVDLAQVKSSSPHGRVTKDDVLHYLEQQARQRTEAAPTAQPPVTAGPPPGQQAGETAAAPAVAPLFTLESRREERIKLSRRRQTIAQRLVEAQHTAAMLTTFNEVDMSAIMALRARHREEFKQRYGISLGFMSFFTKAVVGALKAFPWLNAELQGKELVVKYYYDIGIAVSTDEGLVVPVVRDADRKSFVEIEREIAGLAQRARSGQLTLAELQGGTFTITNGGVFGSLLSTPILNGPQVGILGMHKVEERPVVVAGQIVVRPMMYVALSYDHRVVDGREAVQFLVRVKELVEDPEKLLLEG